MSALIELYVKCSERIAPLASCTDIDHEHVPCVSHLSSSLDSLGHSRPLQRGTAVHLGLSHFFSVASPPKNTFDYNDLLYSYEPLYWIRSRRLTYSCVFVRNPVSFHFSAPFCQFRIQLRITEANTCKVRYCANHLSEVKIDASPVNKEWVECPVGARLELLANPSEVSPNSSRSITK